MKGTAVFSDDKQYRYKLTRRWAPGGAWCTFIMLNPSTATATENDATIRRCIGFSQLWGYQALHVLNLYAHRSRDPKQLLLVDDPVGPDNDRWIKTYTRHHWRTGDLMVAAWGNNARDDRVDEVLRLMGHMRAQLKCLGISGQGAPKHPLRLSGSTPVTPWERALRPMRD